MIHRRPPISLSITILGIGLCISAVSAGAEGLQYPLSVAVHPSGTIYVADRNLPGVWQVNGDQLKLLFQGSKKFRTPLNAVRCVALDADGKLVAGDTSTCAIYRFDDAGQPQPVTDLNKVAERIGTPMDIVTDADGNFLVSDLELHRIVRVPKAGGKVEEFASVNAPRGLFYDSQKQLWVISGRKLLRIAPDGKQETVADDKAFGSDATFPHTVVVNGEGIAYVCDGYAKAIWRVAPGKQPEKWASGAPFVNPVGMDLQGDKLLVIDPHARALFEIDAAGKVTQRELKIAP
jgi:sugar lactone lactonase YvrE